MIRPSRIWQLAAAAYVFVNVGGIVYAVAMGEPTHSAVHVVALFAGYLFWQRTPRAKQQELPSAQPSDAQLEYLQQSVDAIALEVERIGETQRFNEKLKAERVENPKRES